MKTTPAAASGHPFDLDLGDDGPPDILFLHANGFPPRAYERCLGALARTTGLAVHAHALPPLTRPNAVPGPDFEWDSLLADVETWLDARISPPTLLVGHSLGAVLAILMADRRPNRFTHAVLLDPTVLEPALLARWRHRPADVPHRVDLIRRTLARPTRFPDLDAAFAFHRAKRPYARMDDDALMAYVTAAFQPSEQGGVALAYPPAWEARIYETVPDVWEVFARTKLDVTVFRGGCSDVLSRTAATGLVNARPGVTLTTYVDLGHLLPLEAGVLVGTAIGRALVGRRDAGPERAVPENAGASRRSGGTTQ